MFLSHLDIILFTIKGISYFYFIIFADTKRKNDHRFIEYLT